MPRTALAPNNSIWSKDLVNVKHRQHVVFHPNGYFLSTQARAATATFTHHKVLIRAALWCSSCGSSEQSQPLRNQQSPIGQNQTQAYNRPGPAKPRGHEKTPLCCHSGVSGLNS
jgi:hypothetical protein